MMRDAVEVLAGLVLLFAIVFSAYQAGSESGYHRALKDVERERERKAQWDRDVDRWLEEKELADGADT